MKEQTMQEHLQDIRKILLRCLGILAIVFILSFIYVEKLFEVIAKFHSNEGLKLIFTTVEGGFFSKFIISFNFSLIVLLPIFALELMLYLKPAFRSSIKLSIFLFGILLYFASLFSTFKIIIPLFLKFLLSIGFFGVDFYVDVTVFTGFIAKIMLAFAFIFQTPIILILLVKAGVLRLETLQKNRKFIFVLCFVLGAILTPPDVLSQIIAAFLIYTFFEIAIFICKKIKN